MLTLGILMSVVAELFVSFYLLYLAFSLLAFYVVIFPAVMAIKANNVEPHEYGNVQTGIFIVEQLGKRTGGPLYTALLAVLTSSGNGGYVWTLLVGSGVLVAVTIPSIERFASWEKKTMMTQLSTSSNRSRLRSS